MIKNIQIRGFKCLDDENIHFGMLNIITGLNSTGKSSLIQALLFYCEATEYSRNGKPFILTNFDEMRNKYLNSRELLISVNDNSLLLTSDESKWEQASPNSSFPTKDQGLYYLSENRSGPEELAKRIKNPMVGDDGCFLFNLFDLYKSQPIEVSLQKTKIQTLSQNLDYWLSEILGVRIELTSQVVTSTNLKISYKFDELPAVSPLHLGAGVSYLAKILILCLYSKPGEVVVIENPEIHLHPAAQSRLGVFFCWIAKVGVQIILETHCEHLINRVRYETYSKNITAEKVKLFYKSSHRNPFQKIELNEHGRYISESGDPMQFPSGFFDSTLTELLEIG
ncbi:MAG: AAA family ATPase [Fibrobacter sp.]|jgi:predicted ATPase|nr:AAA family ATPase [Fibrobacter sp.]